MSRTRRRVRRGKGGNEPRPMISAREARVWELVVEGQPQRAIAAQLGITQAAVSKIWRRVADRLAAELRDANVRREVLLQARNDRLYREGMDAYVRSQADGTRRRRREVTGADGLPATTVNEADVCTRDGDPRFLEQIGRALDRERQLLADRRLAATGDARRAPADPAAARLRLASRLDRLATQVGVDSVARETNG
jgi:DNA-binding CsgD family transcriptional regulator